MNANNYIGIVTDELHRIFDILNDKYFKNKLESPIITIQKSKSPGWFTESQVWTDKTEKFPKYEINISAEFLGSDIIEIVGVLQHEMVHYSNRVDDIKDCNGQVHNKNFGDSAESVDLIVEKSKKYGFGCTSCSAALITFIKDVIKPDLNSFQYFRYTFDTENDKKEKKTFTYICPECGEKIKAKENKCIICGECDCEFVMKE